ncbi:hypothetical protein B8V81_3325 [Paenibacillus pasadenensis]|uniref:Uncharacterized protein n=1 Tax=Paenibacillus pasadenensis TaxID=217090 RepID=A0A2N5N3G8_9BACL|nr:MULTISPECIES: hypothetical protein [Paenibacillus]PLT44894.1 hypothetical protein B8V81_3325 [Paenibacillus pasadenensis]QGG55341.1 hypothetical protein GE073_06960 [Paenibacillus sp. B01]
MYKLLLILLMSMLWLSAHAAQADEERAVRMLFEAKHAVNRAAHAAAQQLDEEELAEGRFDIDKARAEAAAAIYLQENLFLDGEGRPAAGSRLKAAVVVEAWEVIGREHSFPYVYRDSRFDYEVTLDRPGVVLIVRIEHPRLFSVMEPIIWHVKGTAQLVLP